MNQEVNSPCIGICSVDDLSGLCVGCFRTMDEISQWWDMNDAERNKVMSQLADRQMENASAIENCY